MLSRDQSVEVRPGDRGGKEILCEGDQAGQPMDYLKLEFDPAPKPGHGAPNRQEFQRSQLTELGNADFESWAKESFEIATKIDYRNGGRIGIPKGGAMDCTMIAAAPLLPAGYVVSASRITDRRMILAGYRLVNLLTRILGN